MGRLTSCSVWVHASCAQPWTSQESRRTPGTRTQRDRLCMLAGHARAMVLLLEGLDGPRFSSFLQQPTADSDFTSRATHRDRLCNSLIEASSPVRARRTPPARSKFVASGFAREPRATTGCTAEPRRWMTYPECPASSPAQGDPCGCPRRDAPDRSAPNAASSKVSSVLCRCWCTVSLVADTRPIHESFGQDRRPLGPANRSSASSAALASSLAHRTCRVRRTSRCPAARSRPPRHQTN